MGWLHELYKWSIEKRVRINDHLNDADNIDANAIEATNKLDDPYLVVDISVEWKRKSAEWQIRKRNTISGAADRRNEEDDQKIWLEA